MKKLFLIFNITCIAFITNAQIANTSWKTTLNADQTINTIFIFKADTLTVKNVDENSNLETMKYSLNDTILNIKKLFGQSDCDTTVTGIYSCKITGKTMAIKLISDSCNHRSAIINDIKLQKVE